MNDIQQASNATISTSLLHHSSVLDRSSTLSSSQPDCLSFFVAVAGMPTYLSQRTTSYDQQQPPAPPRRRDAVLVPRKSQSRPARKSIPKCDALYGREEFEQRMDFKESRQSQVDDDLLRDR
jgi:hypothetical protein